MKKLIVIFSSLVMTLLMVSCNNLAGDKQEPAVDSKSQFTVSIVPKKEASRLISPVDRHWIDVFMREDWYDGGYYDPYEENNDIFVPQECVGGYDEQIFELFRMEEPGIYKDIGIEYVFNKGSREAEIQTKLIDGIYKLRINLYYLPVCMDELNGVLVQDIDNKLDLCGEVEFKVNGPNVHNLTVEIGPKKLGTGHAGPFTVEFVNPGDFINDFKNDENVTARLVSRDNPENVYLCDIEEVVYDEPPTMNFEITDSIPSGFYDLELGLVDGNNFIKLVDIDEDLVEIIDDEKTTSSSSIQALDPMNHREYEIPSDSNSEKLNGILDHLKEIPGGRNPKFILTETPCLDMTKFASHKNYSFEIDNGQKFKVIKGSVWYYEGDFRFYFVSDAKIDRILGDISEDNEIWLINNATVTINAAGIDSTEPVSFELNAVKNDFYTKNFEEYYTSGKDVAVVEGDDEGKVQFNFDTEDYKLVKICETTEKGNIYHYRVVKANEIVEGDFNVGTAVPEFKLEGTVSGGEIETPVVFESGEYIEFGDVLFTLDPVCLDGLAEFAPETQFTYTINGAVVPETDMNELKTGISMALARTFVPLNYSGSNLIQCTATLGDYSKSKTFYLKFGVKIDTPVMLWNAAESEVIYNSPYDEETTITGLVGMQAYSLDELENKIKIDSGSTKPRLNAQVKNFCFDPINGDLLIIEKVTDDGCYFIRCNPNELSESPIERYKMEGLESYYGIRSMTWFNGTLMLLDENSQLYSYVPGSTVQEINPLLTEGYTVYALASDRENLYIAQSYTSEEDEKQICFYECESLNSIVGGGYLLEELCEERYGLAPMDGNFNFTVTDMIVQNGDIYALLHESSRYEYSRGALIKLERIGNTFEVDPSFVKGWYELNDEVPERNPLLDNNTNVFYGPRKFIAIKPDVLVIADEGAYYDGSSTKKNSNRVMIYDLNGELKNVYDVYVTLGGAVGAKSGSGSYYEYY